MQGNWSRALRFLTVDLANAAFREQSEAIALVAAGLSPTERQVHNLVLRIRPNPEPPHAADADFDIVTLQRGAEQSRERWSATLQFMFSRPGAYGPAPAESDGDPHHLFAGRPGRRL